MRTVTVSVPDEVGEAVVRNTAEHLRAGQQVILLTRPEGIDDADVPPLVSQMTAMLQVAAGELEALPVTPELRRAWAQAGYR